MLCENHRNFHVWGSQWIILPLFWEWSHWIERNVIIIMTHHEQFLFVDLFYCSHPWVFLLVNSRIRSLPKNNRFITTTGALSHFSQLCAVKRFKKSTVRLRDFWTEGKMRLEPIAYSTADFLSFPLWRAAQFTWNPQSTFRICAQFLQQSCTLESIVAHMPWFQSLHSEMRDEFWLFPRIVAQKKEEGELQTPVKEKIVWEFSISGFYCVWICCSQLLFCY